MGFKPQRSCRASRIEPKPLPPRRFIAVTVNFAMVSPAQRNREFVTDLAAERPVLRKAQMMGVVRPALFPTPSLFGSNKFPVRGIREFSG
jgi:hypothetical protein